MRIIRTRGLLFTCGTAVRTAAVHEFRRNPDVRGCFENLYANTCVLMRTMSELRVLLPPLTSRGKLK